MVKQRMSTADVAAEVASLRARGIVGMRVTKYVPFRFSLHTCMHTCIPPNLTLSSPTTHDICSIYDINPKTYVLKFARSGDAADKLLLLIESGTRFHSIDTMPPKSDSPSNFTLKLRKHIRTRRLESIRQLGVDRIVQLAFGTCNVILELYAGGNVILADSKSYEVLTLLRSHRDDSKGVATMARHIYPIHTVRLRKPLERIEFETQLARTMQSEEEGGKGGGGNNVPTVKAVLAAVLPYGPSVAEHCLLTAGVNPLDQSLDDKQVDAVLGAVREFEKWLDGLCDDGDVGDESSGSGARPPNTNAAPGGVILLKNSSTSGSSQPVYEECEPLLPGGKRFQRLVKEPTTTTPTTISFNSFDAAMNAYFSHIQGQRAEAQQEQRESAALQKLEAIRKDNQHRVVALSKETEAAERRASLIELNLEAVDAALNAVREALAAGSDWQDLGRVIKEEKKGGNPVARLIDSLHLEKNAITLLLKDPHVDEDEEDEGGGQREEKVDVNLDLSAYANARAHFDARKKHADKARRTVEAHEKALGAAEKKAQEALLKIQQQRIGGGTGGGGGGNQAKAAAALRKPYWFERFHWFISTENYLIVSGRNAQQNELLVKRYMRRGDVYVHADLHGAASTIIRNTDASKPTPPLTLAQAGQACVCRSAAWDAKVVTSAYWVYPEQVSRTAPTGEYLTTGSFMIRGRKNYLPPQPLVMGIAWLFRLGEESVAAHLGERAPRLDAFEGAVEGQHHAGDVGGGGGDEDDDGGTDGTDDDSRKEVSALDAFLDASVETLTAATATAAVTAAAAMPQNMGATFDRYGLGNALHATYDGNSGDGDDAGSSVQEREQQQRRHLSAKERQLLKKKKATKSDRPEEVMQDTEVVDEDKEQEQKQKPTKKPPVPQTQVAKPTTTTAQKKSMSKKNKKYEDQDEEDRQLAMALLQSSGQKKDRKQRKEERKVKLAARKSAKSGLVAVEVNEEDIAKLNARLILDESEQVATSPQEEEEGEDGDGEVLSDGTTDDDGSEGMTEEEEEDNDDSKTKNVDEKEEIAQLMMAEEGVALLDDDERDKLTQLDELTGIPRPEDVVLYAIPVCAPYQVVAGYKYKVKLVPGNLKKGKAYKQAVELLTGRGASASGGGGGGGDPGSSRSMPLERELLRAVPEMDGINVMVGGVKLQVAGLQKMQQAKKNAKKTSNKKKK